MARVVFVVLVIALFLVSLAHGRPKKRGTTSNGASSNQGFAALKTLLQNALNENSGAALLSALRSLPKLCGTSSPPSATPATQPANTNQQDFGWLFDLVDAALSQPTIQKMKMILRSSLKLRRRLCVGATRPTPRPTTQPPPAVATNPPVNTQATGGSNFVDVSLKDEGKSGKRAMPTGTNPPRPAAGQKATPTRPPATHPAPADALNDDYYTDEFLSIPNMRKRRSLASDEDQEAEKTNPSEKDEPPEEREIIPGTNDGVDEGDETGNSLEHRETVTPDDEQEFHIAAVIPATAFPAVDDVQAVVPRVEISASNLLEDGQFDETIIIYPEYHDQAAAAAVHPVQEEQEQKDETSQDQKTLNSNAAASSQQTETSPKLRDEKKLDGTPSKEEKITEDPLDGNWKADDVMVTKKEMFSADEMPEQLSPPEENQDENNDNQLASSEKKRNLGLLPVENNELDELEDWQAKKAPKGEEIKYEVDDEPAERITKRKAKNTLKMKLEEFRKKNTFA